VIFASRSAAMVAGLVPVRVWAVGLGLVSLGLGAFVLLDAQTPIWVLIVVMAGIAALRPAAGDGVGGARADPDVEVVMSTRVGPLVASRRATGNRTWTGSAFSSSSSGPSGQR
jgi:hypothetical protein